MDRRVVAIGITMIMVAVIVTIFKLYNPTDQQDLSTLRLPAPSPTTQLGSIFLRVSPTLVQVMDSNTEAIRLPTSTPSPEMIRHGQTLYYELGCFECHGIKAGGEECPPIARTQLSLEEVINQVYNPAIAMPAFARTLVSESDLAAIYAYLQNLKSTPRPQITTDDPDIAAGEGFYLFFGCFGCHGYRGEGTFGPALASTKLSFEEVRTQMRNPRARMPTFGSEWVSDEELAHIYAFLQDLTPDDETIKTRTVN